MDIGMQTSGTEGRLQSVGNDGRGRNSAARADAGRGTLIADCTEVVSASRAPALHPKYLRFKSLSDASREAREAGVASA
jgi:hypothetical protein